MAVVGGDRATAILPPAGTSDDTLVARARSGNVPAHELLMRRYNRRLFRVTRSILRDSDAAQDAMQDAYVRAFTNLESYRKPGNFAAWLTRIAVNEALMRQRKDQRYLPMATGDEENGDLAAPPVNHETPEDLAAGGELRRLIEVAIDRLPHGFRAVFMLRAIEQLSVEETAASLDIPAATVKTRFHRARALMQQTLNDDIEAAGLKAFDFAGARCDRIVESVLERLSIR